MPNAAVISNPIRGVDAMVRSFAEAHSSSGSARSHRTAHPAIVENAKAFPLSAQLSLAGLPWSVRSVGVEWALAPSVLLLAKPMLFVRALSGSRQERQAG